LTTLDDTRPASAADPSDWDLDPGSARYVGKLYLTRMTPAKLRARIASGRANPEFAGMFTQIAKEMDALLAEGFDPAAYAAELRAAAPVAA
jgi:hypothetical protein